MLEEFRLFHTGPPARLSQGQSRPERKQMSTERDFTNLSDSLFAVGDGLQAIAKAIDRLGTGNAGTSVGAAELLAKELRDGFGMLANAQPDRTDLSTVSAAIGDGLTELADAVTNSLDNLTASPLFTQGKP
jgi:hypothetical protein